LTTNLSGAPVPETFLVRVRVPSKGFEQVYSTHNGETVVVELP